MPLRDPGSESAPVTRDALRARAEELLRTSRADISAMSAEDVQALVHELQVHQVELEIQNEELRHAQHELADSRDRYADLYEFAPVGYVTIDPDGRIAEANLHAATLLEVDRRDLVGAPMTRFIAREAQDGYHHHREAVLASETRQVCELMMCREGGIPLVVRFGSIAVGAPGSKLWRSALIDVTEIRRSEEALRELNETLEFRVADQGREVELLAEAISHLGEGVLITAGDLEWPGPKIVFVNRAMCRISGYSEEELISQTPRILQGPETNREKLAQLRNALASGQTARTDLVNYRKDGTPYEAEFIISPIVGSSGTPTHFVSIHRDITRAKRLEQEVINAAEAERQRIAHDLHDGLGSLLTGIKLRMEALHASLIPEDGEHAERSGELADLVMDAIGTTRRIAHGLRPVGGHPEDLMSALKRLCEMVESSAGPYCTLDCPEPVLVEDPLVANNAFRIAQEAANNAVKHSGASEIVVKLRAAEGAIVLTVRDNGTGFDGESISGRGIGLHTMRYRVNAVDGTLRVGRGKQGGTCVRCVLPVNGGER